MAEAKKARRREVDTITKGGKTYQVANAKVDLVVNAEHEIEIEPGSVNREPRPVGGDHRRRFNANSFHFFSVQVAKTERRFLLQTNTQMLFDENEYDDYKFNNKVPICFLSGKAVSFASSTVSIYRQGKMVANLLSKPITQQIYDQKRKDIPFSTHAYYDAVDSAFRPVPDQAIMFKISLKDLLLPTKMAADVEKVEMHKFATCNEIESRLVADVEEYMIHDDSANKHCDLELRCQEGIIKCHKFMLSARSPVLRMILNSDSKEAKTGVIEIKDSNPVSLRQFVNFLYSEEVEKDTDINNLAALLHLADKYDVGSLTKACCQRLQSKMDKENASDILRLARMYKLDLEEAAKEYVAEQAKDVIKTDSWNELLLSDPTVANEIIMKIMK